MVDESVTRREFDRVVAEHERRLQGHDTLYRDLQDTREELVRFTEALKAARDEILSGVTDRDLCKQECSDHRKGFETRIRVLEKFRWQITGIVGVLVAAPAWVTLIWVVVGGGK